MRWIAVGSLLVIALTTGCINRRYPPGVAAHPNDALKLDTAGDAWGVQREIMHAASTPTN